MWLWGEVNDPSGDYDKEDVMKLGCMRRNVQHRAEVRDVSNRASHIY